ncbi:putative bsd domain-containing protein [Eutypa lata UCREL1]|uniref:Putative bsd domain-containing protein n=1 Tax=Eutypa lata (strain UCR-EL1) TaxID=1287681 RepID=M7SJM1_EUTLA|nr:putative bsd domain-containing protein [Eutypa lata UCREL1]
MDLAYDNIVKESLPKDDEPSSSSSEKKPEPQATLNDDIQEAYRAFSSSPWGTWLGGQVGKVVKQGGEVYREAQQEVTSLGVDASRGLARLRARAISLTTAVPPAEQSEQQQSADKDKDKESETTPTATKDGKMEEGMKQSETYLSKLRAEAAKRLKDIQRAEDAADEALLSFGKNFRDFLQDAIVFKPGTSEDSQGTSHRFESKDESGKRVIHTSRYDAQLHVIHTSEKSFTEDPASEEFAAWVKGFDAESKTESISSDLAKYPELRTNMEKLVPDRVPYADFWKRYYFLRHSIETAEARRRDLLKAASAEEEIGWGEESDDETAPAKSGDKDKSVRPRSSASSTTIQPPAAAASDKPRVKSSEPRKSNDEKSQADSDTSYDLVGAASGNPSQAPSSPKESRKADDSEEDDDSSDDDEEDSDDEEWE